MPLPMMAGDPATMLMQPGMQGPAAAPDLMGGAPATTVDPREQQRGVMQVLAQVLSTATETLSTLAQQNPSMAKSLQTAVQAINAAIGNVVREAQQASNVPEPQAPATVR
jgi:hypothetical protein